ncbi:uncharacterized protein Dwil_GK21641 [Drosophila willistoni]|uniref:GK21641 n=1 Tax=Drosophila willistoni TaxID=7260 RepID=B4MPB1_DROWI|nr:TBC1 domain family member 31 [Drosophila willistoni]EDW73950.1 uncharacterized protein Dwil_GK21641 [Drosophila willistoni]
MTGQNSNPETEQNVEEENEAENYFSEEQEEWELSSEEEENEEGFEEEVLGVTHGPLQLENPELPLRKQAFKLKHNKTGNILTVHHTIKENGQQLRIPISACCFNNDSNKLVAIDKRGNIFVFDFVIKRYWRLNFLLPHGRLVRASPLHKNLYMVANKLGQVFVVDLENSVVSRRNKMGEAAIDEMSWGNRLNSSSASNALMRFGAEAVLFNLQSLWISHELQFDQSRYTLKFAGYLPNSDKFFTCFTNDSIHVWSSLSLNTLKMAQPIKTRNRKLRLTANSQDIPEISLKDPNLSDLEDELLFNCQDQDFADGSLLNYCFTPDGNKFCLSCLDGYLLMLSTVSLDLEKIYRLNDFVLKQMAFLPQPKERILVGITSRNQAVMLDLCHTQNKLIIEASQASCLSLSRDGKLLSVLSKCGQVNVWSTCRLFSALQAQTHCRKIIQKTLLKTSKVNYLPTCLSSHKEIRHLLKPDRLKAMLKEYGCYPEKYRFLIWTSLLDLPFNKTEFQGLLKLGPPLKIKNQAKELKIRQEAHRRGVIKIWSCLSQWCKVFAYAEFMPHLIYPFVRQLPKNSLVCFELLVSLIQNHFYLWFEFHPLPPSNYLAMIDNLLLRLDPQLCKFFKAFELEAKDYAWSLLSNAFAEVLEEQQWLVLWDNIITEPPYFPIFLAIAYNVIHREIILRLPDQKSVIMFYHEQNPIDMTKLLKRARSIMAKCDLVLHPQRFVPPFSPVPKGVYPKFLKYPTEWIAQQEEQTVALVKHNQDIEARLRHLELEEMKTMERLNNGLKKEEHTRRLKEMEKLYQDTIQREEERITCQRKMLLTYQMEVRSRKSEVIAKLQESEQRRKVMEMEKDIDLLMHTIERERRRDNQEMQLAEDEIRNQEMELMAQRYYEGMEGEPLAQKYYDKIMRLCKQRNDLQQNLKEMTREQYEKPSVSSPFPLLDIERSILEIQREFSDIIDSDRRT